MHANKKIGKGIIPIVQAIEKTQMKVTSRDGAICLGIFGKYDFTVVKEVYCE